MKLKHLFAGLVLAQATCAFAATDKAQTEQIVRDYILKNPEVIVQSLQTYQQQQVDQTRKVMQQTQETATQFADALFHQSNDPVVGNAKGKVTVVEFFDYQCGHCIEMTPVIEAAIKSNPELRVIYKEFPIRGPASETASRAALAANMQGKYFEFHRALMEAKQLPLTDVIIFEKAKSVGLDMDKLKADMKSDAVEKQLKANNKLARDLKLMGTPAVFIAKSDVNKNSGAKAIAFIPGQIDQSQMQQVIDAVTK